MSEFGDWPPELLARVIKAMAPESVCRECGEPRRRLTEINYVTDPKRPGRPGRTSGRQTSSDSNVRGINHPDTRQMLLVSETTGWTDCSHDDWRSGVVLDPFGTGVTAEVAGALGRVGIEILEKAMP